VLFIIWTDACAPLNEGPTHSHALVEPMTPRLRAQKIVDERARDRPPEAVFSQLSVK
jgi:hypothetical protein